MKIAIGTTNPAKTESAKKVLLREWPHAQIVCINVDSGVSSMPTSTKELIDGAKNRAERAMHAAHADMGVGMEGGTFENEYGMFLAGWVVIIDKQGKLGIGSGPRSQVPKDVQKAIHEGKELGPYLEKKYPEKGEIRKQNGAYGLFTADRVTRPENFDIAVRCALAPFVTEFFK